MKSLIKAPLKALWRWTLPIHRPILRKISGFIARSVTSSVNQAPVTEETGLLMDHMIRELVRLQKQVEHLQTLIEEQSHRLEPGAFTVVGGEARRRSAS